MVISDPQVRDRLLLMAREGTLPDEVWMLFLELAEGRTPDVNPVQSRTLALVRPADFKAESPND
jgi:hypothetical protein